MARKNIKKKAINKKPAKKKPEKKKTEERREPARPKPMPAGRKSIRPFEVCNYYGVYLREIFEKEHLQNRKAKLGEIFECLVSDLHGAWNMVKLYGNDTPLEKLRGEGNPFHHDL